MVKLILIIGLICLMGCANHNAMFTPITYDYTKAPSYPLTSKHQVISVSMNDKNVTAPEEKLEFETLKLRYHPSINKAQIVVYVHFQSSFFVQRSPVSRRVVEYDNNKGRVRYVMKNRGFIRTPYSIEVVDTLNEKLIFQVQGADNVAISARPQPTKEATQQALLDQYYQGLSNARQVLFNTIWQDLKTKYLQDIQVSVASMRFDLVSQYPNEPAFETAFSLLTKNDKMAAKKALLIYNQAYKRYQNKEDEESRLILSYIDDGITAAAQIANDPNPQRYPH